MDPVPCLLTFRTYGTWLPGDRRGGIDRWHNLPGGPRAAPSRMREAHARSLMPRPAVTLDHRQRGLVQDAIREVCERRGWLLGALAVQSNHVHVVLTINEDGGRVLRTLKAWATRRLRAEDSIAADQPVWARHGSIRLLPSSAALERATRYVTNGQLGPGWSMRHPKTRPPGEC